MGRVYTRNELLVEAAAAASASLAHAERLLAAD